MKTPSEGKKEHSLRYAYDSGARAASLKSERNAPHSGAMKEYWLHGYDDRKKAINKPMNEPEVKIIKFGKDKQPCL